ncbi:MAG: hypothetical protein A2148_07105 [Chloroflexi bacterium RBG_16_68_14]|nr:MAG: hypothetical protein A2148_07105 [Chloroflexi bacterium RBG_16_68_14]
MNRNVSNQASFRVIFGTLGILTAVVRLYYARKGSQSAQGISRTREERFRLAFVSRLMAPGWIAGVVYVIAPQRVRWAALPIPAWSRWVGAALGAVALPLFLWTHHALGKNWSRDLVIKEGHTLVTSGPYRWARHPMYTAAFGWSVASFLVSANWLIGLGLLGPVMLDAMRVGEEEALMMQEFGDEYRTYMQRTGRFLPPMKPLERAAR